MSEVPSDELDQLKRINTVLEHVNSSLGQATTNMGVLATTVSKTGLLLDRWTQILSQTEHVKRLILDPEWQGASEDIRAAEIETEELQKQRLEHEEQVREAARAAERAAGHTNEHFRKNLHKPNMRARGRGRGTASQAKDTATRGSLHAARSASRRPLRGKTSATIQTRSSQYS